MELYYIMKENQLNQKLYIMAVVKIKESMMITRMSAVQGVDSSAILAEIGIADVVQEQGGELSTPK